MRRMNWAIGSMLALLLVGGLALDVSAQQPAAPAPPAQTESKPATPPDSGSPASPSAPQPGGQVQTPQVPSTNVQIESRTERSERVVERPGRFLGMDPTVAAVLGAVLLIVIVVALVAMGRRTEDIHTHRV
jgi:Tfp pilus assembly protein FimV